MGRTRILYVLTRPNSHRSHGLPSEKNFPDPPPPIIIKTPTRKFELQVSKKNPNKYGCS
jgi:hypothetical protein